MELPGFEVDSVEAVAERRDELVAAVRDHVAGMAHGLARLQGDYGRESFSTDAGTWTLKHEAGEPEFLRFEGRGTDVYVVSTKHQPEPEPLARALADYGAFVAAWNNHVGSLAGTLDGVPASFPEPAPTEAVVAERDRVVSGLRETADRIAAELHRYEGTDYGGFTARVEGTRWELKRERDRATYLRVGGEGGVYLLSQYGPPSAADLREHAADVPAFVAAWNDHAAELAADLGAVETPTPDGADGGPADSGE